VVVWVVVDRFGVSKIGKNPFGHWFKNRISAIPLSLPIAARSKLGICKRDILR
jgi:hypothetical protein